MYSRHERKFRLISKNIKKYRRERNMTQNELASKVGISLSYLSKIEAENSNKSFSLHVLFDIADVLEIDARDFFV